MRKFDCKPQLPRFTIEGGRLSGARWTRLRNRYIRLNPACERCGMPGQEVHHIVPRAQRPDLCYALHNLMTLCRACHAATHATLSGKRQKPRF